MYASLLIGLPLRCSTTDALGCEVLQVSSYSDDIYTLTRLLEAIRLRPHCPKIALHFKNDTKSSVCATLVLHDTNTKNTV